ncbi:MAG: peptide chain release factor N(5)-glutamine methyltransferase [Ferruginibacter sp.]
MTNKEIYKEYLSRLINLYDANEAAAITNLVFESIAGLKRFDIVRDPQQSVGAITFAKLDRCLAELLQHKPVQYVLGEAWFYNMKLKVKEAVLIPRPETEELVQLVVDDYKSLSKNNPLNKNETADAELLYGEIKTISILDIGTGSGCIAISLAKTLAEAKILALDVSAEALSVAKENATDQSADIVFFQLDFLVEDNWKSLPMLDVIISNPPYIPESEISKLERNVIAFEPHTALFVPEQTPLIFYEKIAKFGKSHLNKNGRIYVEINQDLPTETKKVFEPYYSVKIKKDIFGKDRKLIATVS